jgi:hypothetical protein
VAGKSSSGGGAAMSDDLQGFKDFAFYMLGLDDSTLDQCSEAFDIWLAWIEDFSRNHNS